ncbi:MAG: ABC transporter permease [Candidatus Latescibacterota bacterium]
MLRNHLVVAWRGLLRNRLYAAINVIGLAVGIAFSLLALLYVRHEWTYDAFHRDVDRVYRVYSSGGEAGYGRTAMPDGLAPAIAAGLPQIGRPCRSGATGTARWVARALTWPRSCGSSVRASCRCSPSPCWRVTPPPPCATRAASS